MSNKTAEKFGPQIKYRVGKAEDIGKAIIADEDIPKGTLVHVQKVSVNLNLIGGENELLKKLKEFPDQESKKKFLEHTYAYDGQIYQPTNE